MIDSSRRPLLADPQDDTRFASFTRDLARRQRRPRSYPAPPSVISDALEQLCGGGTVTMPPMSMPLLPDEQSVSDLDDVGAS